MGDWLAEFSNNLASDLGPLLALFGESMTIQYLSECTNISDYIIFATAPIGIITALVSAIRICGGTYLRAFIGRAAEGAAAAEVELCTSTGRDVCELFTRGGISRSLGTPSVLELVHLQPRSGFSETEDIDKLQIYRKYLKRQGGRRWPDKGRESKYLPQRDLNYWMKKVQWQREDPEEGDALNLEAKKVAIPEPDTDLPNLSLNVGIVRPPHYVFWIIATIGVILQTGVLVLAAVDPAGLLTQTSASDPLEVEEPGDVERTLVQNSLLFIIGTCLMCLGMGSCAALIGRATREFTDVGREPERERLLWLQPGNQKIGDQSFDCYAIFETRQRPVNRYIISTMDDRRREKMQLYTVIAAATTLAGFIAQFIGIRGISAWVSIAQLVITIIMSLLRGMVRMQRRGKDDNELRYYNHGIHGHELDWLAFSLSCDDCSKSRYSQDSKPGSETQLHRVYSFQVTGKVLVASEIEEKGSDDDNEEPKGYDCYRRASFAGSNEPVTVDPDQEWDYMSGVLCCFPGPGDGNPYDIKVTGPTEFAWQGGNDTEEDRRQECPTGIESATPFEHVPGSSDGSEAEVRHKGFADIEANEDWEDPGGCQNNTMHTAEKVFAAEKTLSVSVAADKHTVAKSSMTDHATPNPSLVFGTRVRLANLTGNNPMSTCQLSPDGCQSWDPELVRSRHKAGQVAQAISDAAAILFSGAKPYSSLQLRIGISKMEADTKTHQIVTVDLKSPSESTSARWSVDTAAIEALLGLWLWSINEPTSHRPESPRFIGHNEGHGPLNSARIVSTGDGEEHWGRRTYIEGELALLLGFDAPKLQTAKACIGLGSEYGLVAMWPATETAAVEEIWQKAMPSGSDLHQGKRFFGWQRADSSLREPYMENRAYNIQYVVTDASVLDICAQEIYTALITSMASSPKCSRLSFSLSGRGATRQLVNDTFATLRTAFVEKELGTTADAVLCLLSAFRENVQICPTPDNVTDIVLDCLERNDYQQMQPVLRWACLSFVEEDLRRVIRATAELYRRSMKNYPNFGIEGILWLTSRGPSSLRGEDAMLTVYDAAVRRFQEQGRSRLWSGELLKAICVSRPECSSPDRALNALYLLCGYQTLPYVDTFHRNALGDLESCLETALEEAHISPWSVWSSVALGVAQVATKTGLKSPTNIHRFRRTTVCSAVKLDDYDLVYLLLGNGADISYELDDIQGSAIVPAAQHESARMIHLLLPFGEEKEKEILAYKQLLFASAKDGCFVSLEVAVANFRCRNMDLDEKNHKGQTALSLAAIHGNHQWIQKFFSMVREVDGTLININSQDNTQSTPMLWAAKSCPGFRTDEEILASKGSNDTSEAEYLQQEKEHYEEQQNQYCGVIEAFRETPMGTVESELFDLQQRTALSWAAFNGSKKLTELICNSFQTDVNALDIRSSTPLSLAVGNKHTHVAKFLLGQKDCKPNLPDIKGQTPLHLAAANGSEEMVRAFLERWDIDPNSRDVEGRAPLALAALNGRVDCAEILLGRKDVIANSADSFGQTPLILAAYWDRKEVAKVLLQHYSEEDLNIQDNIGWTALCYAIQHGSSDIVEMLIRDERVFVPSPATEGRLDVDLFGITPEDTRKQLVQLGVWKTWEEEGFIWWDKLDECRPKTQAVHDSQLEVKVDNPDSFETMPVDGIQPEIGM